MKKVTLSDIAKELGISKGTVDRAAHNRPDVSSETRQKVLGLMEKYDYRPDKVARSLSLRKKKIRIGFIIQSFPEFYWGNVEKGIVAAGVEFADFGIELINRNLSKGRDVDEIAAKMDELIEDKVDAIILVPTNNSIIREIINKAHEAGIVICTLNDDITESKRAFYIGPQLKQSGRIAGELIGKFLRHGGRVVTVNCELDSLDYHERLEGFNEVLRERYGNISVIANYSFNTEVVMNGGESIVSGILENSGAIDAVYDIDGESLYGIGSIIRESNKLKDIILVGHELSEKVRGLIEDGTIDACISQDPYFQGYFAVKTLYELLAENKQPESDRMFTRADVILRENILNWDTGIGQYTR